MYPQLIENACSMNLIADEIIVDGKFHRLPTVTKPRKKNGFYIVFPDSLVMCAGNFETGAYKTFAGPKGIPSPVIKQYVKLERDREKEKIQQFRAFEASDCWHEADYIKHQHNHYLAAKGLEGLVVAKVSHDGLLFDIRDLRTRQIWNIQRVHPSGDKRFLKGAKLKGLAHPIETDMLYSNDGPNAEYDQVIVICEGIATGYSLELEFGYPVLCALTASNLVDVAVTSRDLWPHACIVIAADNDHLTEIKTGKNPGRTSAVKAAEKVDGVVSLPPFADKQLKAGMTDWNDYLHFCCDDCYQKVEAKSCL